MEQARADSGRRRWPHFGELVAARRARRSTTCAGAPRYRHHALGVLARRTLTWAWEELPMRLTLTVNGEHREADGVWEGESLLYALREHLGLPGSKNACEQGECGSCSVYLDGRGRVLLPRARRAGRGPRGRDGRGDRRWRRAARGPARVRRGGRGAVRVLHARADRRQPRPAASQPAPERPRDPRGAGRQPVPLHGLREDPRRRPAGGERMAEGEQT